MPDWLKWLIIALVVLAIVAAIAVLAGRRKKERNRVEANRLRDEAAARGPELQRHEAAARETEAEAAAARAEADRHQAQAERLEAEAADRHRTAGDVRDEHLGHLQHADELDPDVNTRSKDYDGPDPTSTPGGVLRRDVTDGDTDTGQGTQRVGDMPVDTDPDQTGGGSHRV